MAGDFDLDGKTDLAMLSVNSVSIMLGNGDGSFQLPQMFAVDSNPTGIAKGLFDILRDKKPGLVVSNGGSNTVSILDNTTP